MRSIGSIRRRWPGSGDRLARLDADFWPIFLIASSIFLLLVHHAIYSDWLASQDRLGYFLPKYDELGSRLMAWNPHDFSGAPFAGNPESGWMYLPVMLAFAIGSPTTGYVLMTGIQLAIAAYASYALARLLGLAPMPALVAASSFAFGSFAFQHTSGSTVATHVSTWLAPGFLGVEIASRRTSPTSRCAGVSLGALAVSQMLGGWPGQGSVYALMMVGGWVVWRGVCDPAVPGGRFTVRAPQMVAVGASTLILGVALSAAALLPRLRVNVQSNLSFGNYEDVPGATIGSTYPLWRLLRNSLSNEIAYRNVSITGVVFALVVLSVIVCRRKHGAPYFLGMTVASVLLTSHETIPVRLLYVLLPGFEAMHSYDPKRVLWLAPLGLSMLAGTGVQHWRRLREMRRGVFLCWLPLGALALLDLPLNAEGMWFGAETYLTVAIVCACAHAGLFPPRVVHRQLGVIVPYRMATLMVVLASLWFPTGWDVARTRFLPIGDPNAVLAWNSTSDLQTSIADNLATTDPGARQAFSRMPRRRVRLFAIWPMWARVSQIPTGGSSSTRSTRQKPLRSSRMGVRCASTCRTRTGTTRCSCKSTLSSLPR